MILRRFPEFASASAEVIEISGDINGLKVSCNSPGGIHDVIINIGKRLMEIAAITQQVRGKFSIVIFISVISSRMICRFIIKDMNNYLDRSRNNCLGYRLFSDIWAASG